jgi:hypothetical protein
MVSEPKTELKYQNGIHILKNRNFGGVGSFYEQYIRGLVNIEKVFNMKLAINSQSIKLDSDLQTVNLIIGPGLSKLSEQPAFTAEMISANPKAIVAKGNSISLRLKAFLSSLNMTLYQISQSTAKAPFGKGTRAYIRDAFYAEIESGQTPDIHQIAALAKLTGYRLADWLVLFGYSVDTILPLQLNLHTEHTILLPNTIYDPLLPLPCIRRFDTHINSDYTQALVTSIGAMDCVPCGVLDQLNHKHYIYARIGRYDDRMRPRLMAGSIVRVDPSFATAADKSRSIYLVEYAGGLCCCYLEFKDDQHVILLPEDGTQGAVRCRIGKDLRIIGKIDLELRPLRLALPDAPMPLREGRQPGQPVMLRTPPADHSGGAGAYVRTARERIGIRFRQAHRMTNVLAEYFNDKQYSVALGSLSDFETYDLLPRHISKILSLCIVYAMDFWQYLRSGGVPVDELNGAPVPSRYLDTNDMQISRDRLTPVVSEFNETMAMKAVIAILGEVPFFLLPAIKSAIGQQDLSLDDIYIWGKREPVLHRFLYGALLIIVNRRQHHVQNVRPRSSSGTQPLFLVRLPAGRLITGMCALDGDLLMIHPHSTICSSTLIFRRHEVEVVGRISAILRMVDPHPGKASSMHE